MPDAGQLTIDSAAVNPGTVLPGGTVTVTVVVRETAAFVGPGDPDTCAPQPGAGTGLNAEVTVIPDWANADSQTGCVAVWALTSGRREFSFTFTAPQVEDPPEDRGVAIELRTAGSGKGPEVSNHGITIDGSGGGGQPGCTSDSECPEGTVCVAGDCVPTNGGNGGVIPGNGGLGDVGNIVMWGALGLGALAVTNALDEPESDADAEPQADRVEGVPLPLDQRPEDPDDDAEDA